MRFRLAISIVLLLAAGCASDRATSEASSKPTASTAEGTTLQPADQPACHPENDREDCLVAVVLLDDPIDLAAAESLAADHAAYLNALFRVDAVCVTKDFPMMPGTDLGETASRRVHWQADQRLERIASDELAGLVPPPTIGGFDTVIDARMLDEWRLALEPGVRFDALVLWIDEAGAASLAGEYRVETPTMGRDFGCYPHSEGRGEIRVHRDYDPPPPQPVPDPGCVALDF